MTLIERLEAASGPDRDLDMRIADLGREWKLPGSATPGYAPMFTASLDAALTLVPEGHKWVLHSDGCAGVKLCDMGDDDDLPTGEDWAATPALALCIAALKARGVQ